ncbi:MAG TPA: O-antigen ligase family protein [Thermoanaerobaculia bacterium]|nr:O-antigen ligase family protein [Thermoanaerobaculia bacterium]
MKPARQPSRSPQRSAPARKTAAAAPAPAREPFNRRIGLLMLWLLVLVAPLLISPTAKESFRLIKSMVSGWLALASLFFFAWEVRKAGTIRWTDLWDRPAMRIVLPVLLVATASYAFSAHPLHVREGLADLWIGAAALAGWSLAVETRRLERLLLGLLIPASLLALLGILQFHGVYRPFQSIGIGYDPRLAITSLAGNPGDLGGYLVLPCLIGQWAVFQRRGRVRILAAVALALSLYAVALTQTLAALAAVAVGSALLWALLLPRRQAALLFGGGAALALVLALTVAPLRERIAAKAGQALAGDWNSVLTGRLDGWRAALWMFREHPWTGVGHGAYRPEYVPAMNELLDRGVQLYPQHIQPVFANAHNEYLEALAEWGLPAIPALAWGLWILILALRRARGDTGQALAWAGVVALAILSLVDFPFRIALQAFPALLFLSWVLRRGDPRGWEENA